MRMFDLLRKIKREKKLCIREGCAPEEEEIARRVGITTQKLRKVLWFGREPVSLTDRISSHGEAVTYQVLRLAQTVYFMKAPIENENFKLLHLEF